MHSRLLLCTIIALGMTACVRTPPAAVLKTSPVKADTPAFSAKSSAPLTVASEAAAPTDGRVVRLSGKAIAGAKLEAKTANVKNGFVVGSPLMITEAVTGKLLKQGVTFFDGSFQIDMAAPAVSTPVLVSVDLVDAKDSERTLTLEAPLMLEKGITKVDGITVDVGATAMVQLYRRWSEDAAEAGKPASVDFARYIGSTTAETTRSFGLLVGQDAAVKAAGDVASLSSAIAAYVDRAGRDKRKYQVKRPASH